jgi:hypothetical protein
VTIEKWLCFLALATVASGDTVLLRDTDGHVEQIAVRVEPGAFDQAYVERLAGSELRRGRHRAFERLLVLGSKGGPPLTKPDHVSFGYWKRQYENSRASPNEIAEMIAVGGDSVLRFHDAAGNVGAKILSGKNPLIVHIGAKVFEVVYFSFATSIAYGKQVDVYVRGDVSPTVESGLALLKRFEDLFPDLRVSVSLRSDAWFVFEPSYPFYNPLIPGGNPPAEEEYNQAGTLVCAPKAGSPSCRVE